MDIYELYSRNRRKIGYAQARILVSLMTNLLTVKCMMEYFQSITGTIWPVPHRKLLNGFRRLEI